MYEKRINTTKVHLRFMQSICVESAKTMMTIFLNLILMNDVKLQMEARVFSLDLAAMRERFPDFKEAIETVKDEDGERPTVTVELRDLKRVAPRTTAQVRSYNRLVNYLREAFGITLQIISQKPTKDKWKQATNLKNE